MADDYRNVRPHRLVEVLLHELVWHRGFLQAWWKDNGRWTGLVTFSHPGHN